MCRKIYKKSIGNNTTVNLNRMFRKIVVKNLDNKIFWDPFLKYGEEENLQDIHIDV